MSKKKLETIFDVPNFLSLCDAEKFIKQNQLFKNFMFAQQTHTQCYTTKHMHRGRFLNSFIMMMAKNVRVYIH